jgi:predicted  nucleic acid-binding Zn-ribbon protein
MWLAVRLACVVALLQNNELVEMLQERVRELEAEADTNREQLDDAEQRLKDAQDANQYVMPC